MAFDTHANLIKVTVTAAPSPANSGTTLAISDTDRTALVNAGLTAPFNMGAQPSSSATETNTEILRVTAIGAASSYNAGNTQLTVTRNAETTPGGARSILVGDVLTLDITKKTITDIETQITNNQTMLSDFLSYIHSGLTIPTSVNLSTTCAAGVIFYNGLYIPVASDGGHTYTASQDTYVDVDNTGAYHYSGVSNGATAPSLISNSIRIAKVVTSASAVTSVTQSGRDNNNILIYPSAPYLKTVITTAKARMSNNAVSQSIPSATWTKVQMDTISYDIGSNIDLVNYRFTSPVSGYYQVNASVLFAQFSAVTDCWIGIRKNGTEYSACEFAAGSTSTRAGQSIADIIPLNAGDYLELWCFQNSGSAHTLSPGANWIFLSAHLLSL